MRKKITRVQSEPHKLLHKVKFQNIELHYLFSLFIKNENTFRKNSDRRKVLCVLKNKIKNIEAQIGEILRAPSLGRNLQVLMKKECNPFTSTPIVPPNQSSRYIITDQSEISLHNNLPIETLDSEGQVGRDNGSLAVGSIQIRLLLRLF